MFQVTMIASSTVTKCYRDYDTAMRVALVLSQLTCHMQHPPVMIVYDMAAGQTAMTHHSRPVH